MNSIATTIEIIAIAKIINHYLLTSDLRERYGTIKKQKKSQSNTNWRNYFYGCLFA